MSAPIARLLIVDDERPQMEALRDTLQRQSYATTGYTSPSEALAALRSNKFDVLLTDLMMPDMDGVQLLEAATKMDPELVGIVMTGHGTIDTAVDAMKAGALDYILKPFKLSTLLPVVARALEVRRLRVENTELQSDLAAFSYSVSHDLRAPLRAIDGFSSILLADFTGTMPERARHLAEQVVANAQRMGQLIDDLLRLSRLGRHALSRQTVNISALVHEVLEELRQDLGQRALEIRVGELPECIGDASLLRQVLVNLLSNAFKFTRHKSDAIVEVGAQLRGESCVYFVRDNGAGFDMQHAGKLFGVFERLHRNAEFEGTGIGLSIVQRIVQRHGGRIWADAAVDRGATFFFTLS